MRFDILTLFPGMLEAVLGDSILGRARSSGLIEMNFINIRDYTQDKHRRVDDYPYGGGCGMVMQPMPIYLAWKSIVENLNYKPPVIYMSPQGRVFDQKTAVRLSQMNHLILLCGHYEGIDERIIEEIVDMEISLGDFILTGGEIPAMAVVDAVSRMVPGVLGHDESALDESFSQDLLEYPHYTRPPEFMGRNVPEVLLSGHHANIIQYRRQKAIERTTLKRPDLLKPEP